MAVWCEWRESNPHAQRAQDFKSRLSAYSNTLASKNIIPNGQDIRQGQNGRMNEIYHKAETVFDGMLFM